VHTDDDDDFDALLPEPHRTKAAIHFTPVQVARRAAELLAPSQYVLDVGSGVGKFCIVAAARAPVTKFVGVEQRRDLVEIADRIRRGRRLRNVAFVHGDAFALDWTAFDAFYLFNPFGELRVDTIDRAIVSDVERYRSAVRGVRDRLARARIGTRVVTYHGFGASLPDGYSLLAMEVAGTGRLALWVREQVVRRDRR
jgi:SAM-dependent methyltransferase